MTYIDTDADIIDLRDIIERFEEIEAELPESADDELTAEYEAIESLLNRLRGYGGDEQWRGDWYPVTLIRDSYFENAMDELLEDCGYLTPYADRPSFIDIRIDYSALQSDYASVDIEGVTYWYR